MKRNFLKAIASDVIHLLMRLDFRIDARPFMPEIERNVLEDYFLNSNSILEFGTGGSTLFAIEKNIRIVSVESDKKFYNFFVSQLDVDDCSPNATLLLASTGLTGKYGMPLFFPLSLGVSKKGLSYVLMGYSQFLKNRPDLIFVDGRWRNACCLYSIVLGWENITIILDDFDNDRGYAPVIKKYFFVEQHGRLAVLKVNREFDSIALISDFINCLRDPE